MCGIVGFVPAQERDCPEEHLPIGKRLYQALRRLEYRGYDSAGMAILTSSQIIVKKGVGDIAEVQQHCAFDALTGSAGIAHTRWATHGTVTQANAHPHLSCDGRIAVVHNGILRQYDTWQQQLADEGHRFASDTDSEVIAHVCERVLQQGGDLQDALVACMQQLDGEFACAILDKETGAIGIAKQDSPLAIGFGDDGWYIGSDINAFSHVTNQAVFLEDGEGAILHSSGVQYIGAHGTWIDKVPQTFAWGGSEEEIHDFSHYMLKEIHEIPQAVQRIYRSLCTDQQQQMQRLQQCIASDACVVLTGCGTSYHAAAYGAYLLHMAGYNARAVIASEFQGSVHADANTVVIGVSQSGETMDVLQSMKYAQSCGSTLVSVVNVPYSSIQRLSDVSIETRAGQEYCVVSTKTFMTTCVVFMALGEQLGLHCAVSELSEQLRHVIDVNTDGIARVMSQQLSQQEHIYVIGRGNCYPAALEMALKLKETSYIHAEGMMGGELKHGTLALIEPGTVVIALSTGGDDPIEPNIAELVARGGHVIRVSPDTDTLYVPDAPALLPLSASVIGFLMAYYTAERMDLPIDKPRNLAKSVTVV